MRWEWITIPKSDGIGDAMAEHIEFSINGTPVRTKPDPSTTLLDYLRIEQGLTGTKEGCNEGDCGACTVMVSERHGQKIGHSAVNACILFLPQLHGKSIRTVEGVSCANGSPNCVQQAMVDLHASQCGFCTPGFVMSLVSGHLNRSHNHNDVIAGNLCRCTGYAPIVRAAEAAFDQELPAWSKDIADEIATERYSVASHDFFIPGNVDELATWLTANPDATIVAGATDVGLWATKQLREIRPTCFIAGIPELGRIQRQNGRWLVGACATLSKFRRFAGGYFPSLSELIRRFGSVQVRNSATVGGNIANGSPIGDLPPALIALGAQLVLQRGNATRTIPIGEFFIDYGKQDLLPGEFLRAIEIPDHKGTFGCYKLSKRFDQDISAVCGCFRIWAEDGVVREVRLAFGGMAATPKQAKEAEKSLIGQPWNEAAVRCAMDKLSEDFSPISDMRASADYRMETAQNMLLRFFVEQTTPEEVTNVLEVLP